MNEETYNSNPRDYALEMVEEGLVSADDMLLCCLKYMSHDDVRGALDTNELSPRFEEEDEEVWTYDEESEVVAAFWGQFSEPEPSDGYTQNELPADTRMAFVGFVDELQKSGSISEELAETVTLEN